MYLRSNVKKTSPFNFFLDIMLIYDVLTEILTKKKLFLIIIKVSSILSKIRGKCSYAITLHFYAHFNTLVILPFSIKSLNDVSIAVELSYRNMHLFYLYIDLQ